MSAMEAASRWYLVLLAVTVAAAPWVRLLCTFLPDRGAGVVRPLGLLGAIFPLWFLAGIGLLPYSTVGLWVTVVAGGVVGWGVVIARRLVDRGWLKSLLVVEALAVATFLGYVWLRGYTPEIDNTEKPMDMALLSASARATEIPPDDPWFAGEGINYYYLGYLVHGSVSRMAGVPTQEGFNLALATTCSMAIVAAGSLGFNATRRYGGRNLALIAAVAAAFLLVIAGNLYAPKELLAHPRATIDANWWDKQVGIGWRSSRIVCDGARVNNDCPSKTATETINEFPAFSFLLGDLHPHVMALPFTLMALALALNLLFAAAARFDRRSAGLIAILAVSGAAIGSLYALNSWDYPTFLLVALVATWLGFRAAPGRRPLAAVATVAVASVVAWIPFYLHFSAPIGAGAADLPGGLQDVPLLSTLLSTLAAYRGERTSAGEFLTVFGVPYVVALWFIGTGFVPDDPDGRRDALSTRAVAGVAIIGLLAGVLFSAPTLVLCGAPLLAGLWQLSRARDVGPRQVATGLYALGFLLIIGTDFFYIQDLFNNRMNTVFKVYYQSWTLLAVATAIAGIVILREARRPSLTRPLMAAAGAVVLVLGIAYPTVASYQWTSHFGDWKGLDGLAYLRTDAPVENPSAPDEAAAIAWLIDNATDKDVLLEGAGCSYGYLGLVKDNRASAFTGIPTVIGWGWHETQWRNGQPELNEIKTRQEDVSTMYGDPQSPLFDRYGVTLMYVGSLEREGDPGCSSMGEPYAGITNPGYPGTGWQLAFSSGDVAIYRRETGVAARGG